MVPNQQPGLFFIQGNLFWHFLHTLFSWSLAVPQSHPPDVKHPHSMVETLCGNPLLNHGFVGVKPYPNSSVPKKPSPKIPRRPAPAQPREKGRSHARGARTQAYDKLGWPMFNQDTWMDLGKLWNNCGSVYIRCEQQFPIWYPWRETC